MLFRRKKFSTENRQYFLFFFTKSENCANYLKEYLQDYKYIDIKMDKMNFKEFYYQNKTILGWNKEQIYLGNIYSNKFKIIEKNNKSNNYKIIFICLNPNIIFYDNSIIPDKEDNNSEDNSIENFFFLIIKNNKK